jgi:hypothetical protein
MTLAFVGLSILPIISVDSRLGFALKITAVIVVANVIGVALFLGRRRSMHG